MRETVARPRSSPGDPSSALRDVTPVEPAGLAEAEGFVHLLMPQFRCRRLATPRRAGDRPARRPGRRRRTQRSGRAVAANPKHRLAASTAGRQGLCRGQPPCGAAVIQSRGPTPPRSSPTSRDNLPSSSIRASRGCVLGSWKYCDTRFQKLSNNFWSRCITVTLVRPGPLDAGGQPRWSARRSPTTKPRMFPCPQGRSRRASGLVQADGRRIVVFGESVGGNLAAALVHEVRRRGGLGVVTSRQRVHDASSVGLYWDRTHRLSVGCRRDVVALGLGRPGG